MSRIHREWMAELNPRALEDGRIQRAFEVARRRENQRRDAYHFLTTGLSKGIPPYQKEWNREYNPWPDPWSKPDPLEYEDTGIGAVYGFDGSDRHAWQLAGWNITRAHAEVRARKKY